MMPIVSRQLESVQPSAGSILASWLAIDDRGREWRRSRSRFASEAVAQTALDAFDWTIQLKDADFADLLVWVQAKNSSDTFDFTNRDLTLLEGEERLLIWFASHEGPDAITLAWWVEDMSPPTYSAIRNRAGYDAATGTRIQDRAVALLAVEPVFDVIENVP
jgi:hypothetical protein